MNKVLVFAVLVMAIGLLFSCTSDIESAEDILGKMESSSSEQGVSSGDTPSSSSSSQGGSVLCDFGSGICAEILAELCSEYGQAVESCPETGNSSSSVVYTSSSSEQSGGSSSSSLPSGAVLCVLSGTCTEVSAEVCAFLSGTTVQSCPVSSSSALPSSSSIVGNSSESQEIGRCENDEFTDPRDGKKYKCEEDPSNRRIWMSENLNYSRGNTIGFCYNETERTSLGTAGVDLPGCSGGYGRVYTWEIAMDGNSQRGLCPNGWHIPSLEEWTALGAGTSSSQLGTRRMSNAFYIYSGNYDVVGYQGRIPGWNDRGKNGFYWTSNNKNNFVIMGTDNGRNYFNSQNTATNIEYYSIRCVFDNPASSPSSSSVGLSSSVVPSSSSVSSSSINGPATTCEGERSLSTYCPGINWNDIKWNMEPTGGGDACYYIWDVGALACPECIINGELLAAQFTPKEQFPAKSDGGYYIYVPKNNYPSSNGTAYDRGGLPLCKVGSGYTRCGNRVETFDPNLYECRNGDKIYLKNQNYEAVLIGSQTWMTKNLDINATGSRCYGNDNSNCATYGRLYDWATAMGLEASYNNNQWNGDATKYRGICPNGWHIPTNAEWTTLIDVASGGVAGGAKLIETNDIYGFAAKFVTEGGYWWSTTQNGAQGAYHLNINKDGYVSNVGNNKSAMYSVRCVMD